MSDASGYNVYGGGSSSSNDRGSNIQKRGPNAKLNNNNNSSNAAVLNSSGYDKSTFKASALSYQYTHNAASLSFLLPALFSILWYHDKSPLVVQVAIFVMLVIYLLDLINARDGLCVGVWVGALVLTMVSGFMTLLEVDDADATGSSMILYMLRLAVEGMSFCSWVSSVPCE
ncbi:MAG: hypothetical protein SGILL_003225 [Bacillariaceae sp.]